MSNEQTEQQKQALAATEEETSALVQPEEPEEEAAALPKKKGKKKKIILLVVIIAVIACVALKMCSGGAGKAIGSSDYSADAAAYRDLQVSVSGTGTIEPIHSATVRGMVTGDILSDSFEIGDQVEKDQILYVIDSETAQNGVEQAQLAIQQAELSLHQAQEAAADLTVKSTVSGQISDVAVKKGDSVSAGMTVATVTDNATMTLKCNFNSSDAKSIYAGQAATVTMTATGETVSGTVKNVSGYITTGAGGTLVQAVEISVKNPGGISGGMAATARVGNYACQSGGTFDYATQTAVLAKASGTVDAIYVSEGGSVSNGTALVHLSSAATEDQVKNAQLAVENARISLKNAQTALDNYSIKAPIAGTITEKDLSAGDSVGEIGTTTMAVISDLSALTFDMKIDELDIPSVAVGQKVEITVDALPGRTFSGYVDKINVNGTTAGGATSYPVTIMIENPDPDLLPGMNVSADIIIEKKTHVLTVPTSAVSRGNTVQVVPASAVSEKDGSIDMSQAKEVQVELGANNDDYVEILSGLSEGDLVLVSDLPPEDETGGAGGFGMGM